MPGGGARPAVVLVTGELGIGRLGGLCAVSLHGHHAGLSGSLPFRRQLPDGRVLQDEGGVGGGGLGRRRGGIGGVCDWLDDKRGAGSVFSYDSRCGGGGGGGRGGGGGGWTVQRHGRCFVSHLPLPLLSRGRCLGDRGEGVGREGPVILRGVGDVAALGLTPFRGRPL